MQRVTDNIYQINGAWGFSEILGGNVFFLADNKLTLVDAGFTGSSRKIIKAAKKLGFAPDDIANIIITHHHPDHISGLASLKKVTDARVLAHIDDAPYIEGRLSQPGPSRPAWLRHVVNPFRLLWATRPVSVDVTLRDGDELPILGGIKIVHTPGHTPGSIILYFPKQKLIITGDLLTHGDKLYLPSREFTVDTIEEVRSIQKVAGLDFDIACFGHGSPILNRANWYVRDFADKLKDRYQLAAC